VQHVLPQSSSVELAASLSSFPGQDVLTYNTMSDLGLEVGLVVISFAIYVAYHIWFFIASGFRDVDVGSSRKSLFNSGKIARAQFSELICNSDDTISGIQQNRNCLLAVAFLSGTASILAQKLLSILLDDKKLEQVRSYGVRVISCILLRRAPDVLTRHCSATTQPS
jgi:hypothetical protein